MTVSVVMAAFNAAATIERAIESAVRQTAPPLEIIVVDDASTDTTRAIVRRLAERWPSVKLIELPQNKGPSTARNVGIDSAKGDWIAITDADDAWKTCRLETLTRLGEATRADFIADNLILFDWDANRDGGKGFYVDWYLKKITARDLFESAIPEAPKFNYATLKPLLRKSFLSSAASGIRYDENSRYGEDFSYYAELLFNGMNAWLTSEAMYVYTTGVGEFSGKPNIHRKSIPRFDLVGEMNDSLERKYEIQMDADFRRSVARRRKRLRAVHLANIAREHRRSQQYHRYAAMVLTHPDLLSLLLLRSWKRLEDMFRPLRND
jgi:succinoglycan biosynthesis protein ExoO